MVANFTAANIAAKTAAKTAILNISRAMGNAGYADNSSTILVQDAEAAIARGRTSAMRSRASPASRPVAAALRVLELSHAFDGRQLCSKNAALEEKGLANWKAAGAADHTEWIDQIRSATAGMPYFQQESLHPNYWGQLALRNCIRQAYNGGSPRGGICTIAGTGLNARGQPRMTLGH